MYFILTYQLVDNYIEKRTPYRPSHFELVKEFIATGELIMGGAFDDEEQAILVFKVDDEAKIKAFTSRDPYVANGVVDSWAIRKWNMVTGDVIHDSLR